MGIFRNSLLIEKIFSYLKGDRLNYLMLSHGVNQYLFDRVLVEFSMTKYLLWLITSKSYEPISFVKLLYWDVVPVYIPSKLMNDLKNILSFLHLTYFKRVRVVINNQDVKKHQISAIELSNRLSSYLILDNRLGKHFSNIEEIIVKGMTMKLDLEHFKPRYLNLGHTRIKEFPKNSLEVLVVDIKNIPIYIKMNKLRRLKLIDNPHFSFNYLRFFKQIKWEICFPNLEILYIGMYHLPWIDLTGLTKLREVYAHPETTIKVADEVKFYREFQVNQIDHLFECQLINQDRLFKNMISQ